MTLLNATGNGTNAKHRNVRFRAVIGVIAVIADVTRTSLEDRRLPRGDICFPVR